MTYKKPSQGNISRRFKAVAGRTIRPVASLLLAGLLAAPLAAAGQILKVGDRAPDFTLNALDQEQVSLADFKGRVVFINFFGYD